ncbi:acyl-CoA N-acyltransferase [Xylariales sp. AK1849]|nr:acyl-CoA N-acyltransferase [Xylariales sp. AK1849]
MAPSVVHLPDGQVFTAQPVFSGLFFKSKELNTRHTPFPAGWTVVLHTEEENTADQSDGLGTHDGDGTHETESKDGRVSHIRKFSKPTLRNDTVFISSISNPSADDFEPAKSPSRQIALMLWISLYWYFQQPEPLPYLETAQSKMTPAEAKPQGDWRIRIKREGVLRSRNMIPKLERMGLISTLDSAVGTSVEENSEGWDQMYVTRQSFWQIPSGLFLFTLQSKRHGSHPGSPINSRPNSPVRNETSQQGGHSPTPSMHSHLFTDIMGGAVPTTFVAAPSFPIGPYYSASHLPTYYPPPPLQYTVTNGVRHPIRPKPPRLGEIFYTRFIPSVGKYLSLRVASSSTRPVPYLGPVGTHDREHTHLSTLTDSSLLRMWLSNPRVSAFWGGYHSTFLTDALQSKHSFPVIGLWDGAPFGYFEIYWVKEDHLGKHINADDFDRGVHVLVGEEWARGKLPQWMSSLTHWVLQADNRTMSVCLEPRVDNHRFIQHLQSEGFCKERQVSFPHKQAWLCRLPRETWRGPCL